MNYRSIINLLGWLVGMEGALMVLPLLTALICREPAGIWFLVTMALCFALCFLLTRVKRRDDRFYLREGYVTVALAWILLSLMGALPFTLSGEIPSYVDAVFEIVSGFTTTGSSILSDVEALSRCMMFWRCFTHWIGGMGVLVFALAIMPLAGGGSSFSLMQAESPGPSVSKLVPHLRASARSLYLIYTGFTVLEIILLCLGGMPVFESICNTFGTVGTGGFAVLNSSCASYNTYLQVVITVFMILCGTNFTFFYLCVVRRFREAVRMEEVRWYLIIIFGVSALIAGNLCLRQGGSPLYNFQQAIFQVASLITTTGFATCDFDLWPQFSKTLLIMVMFIGACAGSTGGGLKVSRILIYFKAGVREARSMIRPRRVSGVRLDGRPLDQATVRSAMMFLGCYVQLFMLSLLLVSLDCEDFTTCFTAVTTAINNVGPGFALVGPTCNFGFLSPLSKLVLTFDMLVGRLEIFPILILLVPSTWKK